jgi:hypothetical protein
VSVSRKKKLTRTFFLGVTAVALITECWFAWDGDPETDPWTDLIGDYVPWQAALAVFGALLLWVPAHFVVRYRREAAEQAANRVREVDILKRCLLAHAERAEGLAASLHREMPDKYDTRGRYFAGGSGSSEQDTLF